MSTQRFIQLATDVIRAKQKIGAKLAGVQHPNETIDPWAFAPQEARELLGAEERFQEALDEYVDERIDKKLEEHLHNYQHGQDPYGLE